MDSFINQTYPNIEVIAVDNGSTDGTREILKSYAGVSVKILELKNIGPSLGMTQGLLLANGEYCSLSAGDDEYMLDKVERQMQFIKKENLDAVFSLPELVDDNGDRVEEALFPHFSNYHFSSEAQMIHRLFHTGNFLCGSTSLIETQALKSLLPFHPGSLQFHDAEIWLRLAARYKVKLLPDRLIRYLVRIDQGNLSNPADKVNRIENEKFMMYFHFFDQVPDEKIISAFPDIFSEAESYTSEQVRLRLPKVYFSHANFRVKFIGYMKLFEILKNKLDWDETFESLYGDIFNYYNSLNHLDVFNEGLAANARKILKERALRS